MSLSEYKVPLGVTGVLLVAFIGLCSTSLKSILAVLAVGAGLAILQKYMRGGQYYGNERVTGKTIVVTGANCGIGKETAKDLARRGGRIIMACRDMESAERARNEIIEETGNQNVICKKLDLASLESVRVFCKDFNATEDRLDILINNAGVMFCPKSQTEEGIEMHFGVNHIGHFLLTNLLLDRLKASAPSRIIIVSSLAHELHGKMYFDDINLDKNYSARTAYGQSKLANLLHVLALSKRLQGTGVTVNGLHPGVVDTHLSRHIISKDSILYQTVFSPIRTVMMKTSLEGAQTTLRLALDPSLETVSGKYFSDCKEKKPARTALDEDAAEHLWKLSEELTAEEKK